MQRFPSSCRVPSSLHARGVKHGAMVALGLAPGPCGGDTAPRADPPPGAVGSDRRQNSRLGSDTARPAFGGNHPSGVKRKGMRTTTSTSTGTPAFHAGWNFHFESAEIAASSRR